MDAYNPPPVQIQANAVDVEHVKILSICHYVVGGLHGLLACLPLLHLVFGVALYNSKIPLKSGPAQPPIDQHVVGAFVIAFASVIIAIGWTFAGLILAAGNFLGRRKSYTFCFVVACIECICFPLGTILGIFTLIVLCRPSVKLLFQPPTQY
jgi:hypothetical protein